MLNWVLLQVGGTSGTSEQEKKQKKSKASKQRSLSVAPQSGRGVVCVCVVGGVQTEALLKKSIKKKKGKDTSDSMVAINEVGRQLLIGGNGRSGGGGVEEGETGGCLGAVWRVTPHPSCCCPESKP